MKPLTEERLSSWPVWWLIGLCALFTYAGGLVLGILGVLLWYVGRRPSVQRLLLPVLSDAAPARGQDVVRWRWFWWGGGLAILALALFLLEWQQPFYFSQDDNLVQFLPVILHGSRSLLEGTFPVWNPHQFLGAPTSSVGTYALTYPLTYLAYVVSRFLLANENTTLEVFCILHLLAGYLATYIACRLFGVRPSFAAAASLCFALSGYFLIAGRSWYYMAPVATWLPCSIALLGRLRRDPVSWRWIWGMAVVIGLWFHSGNAQMWFYGLKFLVLAILVWVVIGAVPLRRTVPALCAILLGIGLALPLLLPQLIETGAVPRTPEGGGIGRGLLAMLLPWPLVSAPHPNNWGNVHLDKMGQFYYSGTILVLPALLGMLSLLVHRWPKKIVAGNFFLLLALVALLFALGEQGILWQVFGLLPPFSQFSHPFKYLPFFTLFAILGGTILIERFARRLSRAARWEAAVFALVAALMTYHAWTARASFYSFRFQPYAPPPAGLQQVVEAEMPQRLYAVAPGRSDTEDYMLSMTHNLPTAFGLYSPFGYDPLVRRSPLFDQAVTRHYVMDSLVDFLRTYGVKWILIHRLALKPHYGPNPLFHAREEIKWIERNTVPKITQEGAHLVSQTPAFALFSLPDVAPLAYREDTPHDGLPTRFDGAGVSVDLTRSSSATPLIVNVLWRPFLRAYAEGEPIDSSADDWGRVRVNVPPGTTTLRLSYKPPWGLASVLAGLLMGGALLVFHAYQRFTRSSRSLG